MKMSLNTPHSFEEIPSHVERKAREIINTFEKHSIAPAAASQVMRDVIALSQSRFRFMAESCDHDLRTLRNLYYPSFSQADFAILLELLSEKSPFLAGIIQSSQGSPAHHLANSEQQL